MNMILTLAAPNPDRTQPPESDDDDSLRAYVLTLRNALHISQQTLATMIGLSRRAYIDWETGATHDMKLRTAKRLIKAVGGSLEHIGVLDEMTADEARDLAREWTRQPDAQRLSAARSKLQRVIELTADDPLKLEQVVERLRADSRVDPSLLDALIWYLDGRRSSRE